MVCTDLTNTPAPANSAVATLHPNAFIKWMEHHGAMRIDNTNTKQVVAILFECPEVNNGGIRYTPNWHLTAMTDRLSTVCNNFHFKIEATKALAHYWHYVIHYHAGNATFHFVGDVGNVPGRNDAGGGAAGNLQLLNGNLAAVNVNSTIVGLDNGVTIATQTAMEVALNQLAEWGQIFLNNGVWR
jgi:hypothetical protein